MSLSADLISQFVQVTKPKETKKEETTVYGVAKVQNGSYFVQLDGSELLTPMITTSEVVDGERIAVMIKNHKAICLGNVDSPAARIETVNELGTYLSSLIADKATIGELNAVNAQIGQLTANDATINGELTAIKGNISVLDAGYAKVGVLESDFAEFETATANNFSAVNGRIDTLDAGYAKVGTLESDLASFKTATTDKFTAVEAKIDTLDVGTLRADFAELEQAVTEDLEATNAKIKELDAGYAKIGTLETDYGNFKSVTTNDLTSIKGTIQSLGTTYANIDFTNIGKAAMEYFYAQSGLIQNVTVGDAKITGELVGVTIRGDRIIGGTVIADKLVMKGTDGLYYKLNTDGVKTEAEQTSENSLDGKVILANSITATKIDVQDLVAFDATIGGFKIGSTSIYSGVKESINNTTQGLYLGSNGQFNFGDANNYIKYFLDTDGKYKIRLAAEEIELGAEGTSVGDAVNKINNLKVGGRNYFSSKTQTAFNENNEYTLADYQGVGSFTQFYNLTVPMSTFVGEKCRISFDVISPNGNTTLMVYNSNSNPRYLMGSIYGIPVSTEWTHQEHSVSVYDQGTGSTTASNKIEMYSADKLGVKIRNVKFELGTQATDYTPAPEDMDLDIANAQSTADEANTNAGTAQSQAGQALTNSTTALENAAAANDKIDNLEVGGRNYLTKNQSNMSAWTNLSTSYVSVQSNGYTSVVTYTTVDHWEIIYLPLTNLAVGEEYTLSFDYTVQVAYARYQNYLYGVNVVTTQPNISYPPRDILGSFAFPNTVTGKLRGAITFTPSTSTVYIEINGGTIDDGQTGISFEYGYWKLEKGNRATDWTPAPEDVDEKIEDETSAEKLVGKINTGPDGVKIRGEKVDIEGNAIFSSNKAATDALINEIQNEVANIEVGGRNLFKQSGRWTELPTWWSTNGGGIALDTTEKYLGFNTLRTTVGAGIAGNNYNYIPIEPNTVYTYSAVIKSNENVTGNGITPLHAQWSTDGLNDNASITVLAYDTTLVAGEWKRIFTTIRTSSTTKYFRPFIYRGAQSTVFNIAYLKFEKGNKPTDWTPAPEDVDDAIQEVDSAILNWCVNNDKTYINGAKIYTGTITTDKLSANAITADKIAANAVTADKISVTDLSALNATIGGLHLTGSTIYSGSKSSVGSTVQGLYLDSSGQMNLGNADNYLNFANGALDIKVNSLTLTNGINGLDVGGRNLITKSRFDPSNVFQNSCSVAYQCNGIYVSGQHTYDYYAITLTESLVAGEKYTFSCRAASSANAAYRRLRIGNVKDVDTAKQYGDWQPGTTEVKITKTFTATNNILVLGMYPYASSTAPTEAVWMYAYNIKLEKGTVATDYTPAPEDSTEGGRNFIRNSHRIAYGGYASGITPSYSGDILKVVATSGNGNWMTFSNNASIAETELATGDLFTISFTMRSDDSTTKPTIYIKSGMGYYGMSGNLGRKWSTIWYTGVWSDTNNIQFHMGWSSCVGTYYIKNVKLERGSCPTAWSPAPEDLSSQATNYLDFSSAGLVVGDHTGSTLKGNVLIDSDSVDIRNGTTKLASFEANKIKLGIGSQSSSIIFNPNSDTDELGLLTIGPGTSMWDGPSANLTTDGTFQFWSKEGLRSYSYWDNGNEFGTVDMEMSVFAKSGAAGTVNPHMTFYVDKGNIASGNITHDQMLEIDATNGISLSSLNLPNYTPIKMARADGTYSNIVSLSPGNSLHLGVHSLAYKATTEGIDSNLYLYAKKLYFKLAEADVFTEYQPYYCKGQSITAIWHGCGYVTNSGKDVYFTYHFSKPVIGNPTITLSNSSGGFVMRQGNAYTHGTANSSPGSPTLTAYTKATDYVVVKATFSTTTNVTNNSPIGIAASFKITFS